MIPYSRQEIDDDDIEVVKKVLLSDLITQGPKVEVFEEEIGKKVGAKYAYAMNSATSALHISCLSMGLKTGDILWTSPNSFVASANCGLYCGANIDFVDIDPSTYNISVEALKLKLEKADKINKIPKILVTVDFAGQAVDQREIWELSKKYNFKILEDASHALGAERDNIPVGKNKWSDITVFSFHPVKMITSAEGGMAVTDSEIYAKKINLLRTHGITRDKNSFVNPNDNPWYYEQLSLGYNYRMSELHAALGNSQLKKINKFLKKRNNLANNYNKLLKNLPISLPKVKKNNYSSFHLYVIRLDIKNLKKDYKTIFNLMRSNNIGVNLHYLPIHLHPFFARKGFKKSDFPVAEKYSQEAMSLPIFSSLEDSQQEYICKTLKAILS